MCNGSDDTKAIADEITEFDNDHECEPTISRNIFFRTSRRLDHEESLH